MKARSAPGVSVDAYGELASWYDDLYAAAGKDYAAEARAVTALVRARSPVARSLLDVACGTGGHLLGLREHFAVAGLDASAEMLALARTRLPGVPLHRADMRTFALGARFDAVTCLFSSVGYLTGRGELDAAVARMAAHLNPGGVLLVEGWVTPERWTDGHVGALAVAKHGETVTRVDRSQRHGRLVQLEMHYLLRAGGERRYVVEPHRLRLHTRAEYLAAFARAGLVDVAVDERALTGRGLYLGVAP